MAGDVLMHMAPPAHRVPVLMVDLLRWLGRSPDHPLIASSVFHYELELIHPCTDGNGRMGRLWRPLFADLAVESLVHSRQADFYPAIERSTAAASATPFVELMLGVIRTVLSLQPEQARPQGRDTEQESEQVRRLPQAIGHDRCPARTLMERLGLRHRPSFVQDYLHPALEAGLVAMTDPDHPRSPRQAYCLAEAGRRFLMTDGC
jgi:Fic family protein